MTNSFHEFMKYILVLLPVLLFLTSCENRTCSYEFPTECHSQKEWDKNTQENWAMLACLDKEMIVCNKTQKCFNKALKKCNVHITTTVILK